MPVGTMLSDGAPCSFQAIRESLTVSDAVVESHDVAAKYVAEWP